MYILNVVLATVLALPLVAYSTPLNVWNAPPPVVDPSCNLGNPTFSCCKAVLSVSPNFSFHNKGWNLTVSCVGRYPSFLLGLPRHRRFRSRPPSGRRLHLWGWDRRFHLPGSGEFLLYPGLGRKSIFCISTKCCLIDKLVAVGGIILHCGTELRRNQLFFGIVISWSRTVKAHNLHEYNIIQWLFFGCDICLTWETTIAHHHHALSIYYWRGQAKDWGTACIHQNLWSKAGDQLESAWTRHY